MYRMHECMHVSYRINMTTTTKPTTTTKRLNINDITGKQLYFHLDISDIEKTSLIEKCQYLGGHVNTIFSNKVTFVYAPAKPIISHGY